MLEDLCILFFYHRCDNITELHLRKLKEANPRAKVIPVTDTIPELLPNSVDVGRSKSNWDGQPKWRGIDTTLYRWFLGRECSARRYVVIEYDCSCDVDLLDYYDEVLDSDVAGADFFDISSNPQWAWFNDSELSKLPEEDRPFASGVVPFTCTLYSHDALDAIVSRAYTGDVFCELRLGTIIRKLGLRFQRLPPLKRSKICWHTYPWRVDVPGLFHSVKACNHNDGRRASPKWFAAVVHEFMKSLMHDREALPFVWDNKMRAMTKSVGNRRSNFE